LVVRKETQISALISETTRELLEKQVRATGVKKGHLVEQALLHHLQALDALPAEFIIHPRIVVSRKTFQAILRQMEEAKPTPAHRKLRRDGD
jgi:hypothetical protein